MHIRYQYASLNDEDLLGPTIEWYLQELQRNVTDKI